MNSPIIENKPCCCLDEDEYTCYYLRVKKRFGRKQAEKYLEDADDSTYCRCKCHADAYKAKGEDIISENFFDKEFMVKSEFERGGQRW